MLKKSRTPLGCLKKIMDAIRICLEKIADVTPMCHEKTTDAIRMRRYKYVNNIPKEYSLPRICE